MVQFTISFLFGLLAIGSNAAAAPKSCMTDQNAHQVLLNWQALLVNYSPNLASEALHPAFTYYSASAASLNNVCPQDGVKSPPLEDPLYTSRTEFEAVQAKAAPVGSQIEKSWHTCDAVFMRWVLTNTTQGGRNVPGLIAFDTVKAPAGSKYAYKIKTAYSEFDVQAWIANLRDKKICNPQKTSTAIRSSASTPIPITVATSYSSPVSPPDSFTTSTTPVVIVGTPVQMTTGASNTASVSPVAGS